MKRLPLPSARTAVLLGVGAALVLAFAVRRNLDEAAWWFNPDEGVYHQVATLADRDLAQRVMQANAHPPLHFVLLHALAGVDEGTTWLRLPSLIAGLLLVPALAYLGWLCGRHLGALFAALMAAVAPALAVQSVVMRPYTLQVLALTLGLIGLLRALATGRARWYVLFSAGFTWAVLEQYASLLVVGAVGVALLGALLLRRLTRRQVLALLLAALPVAAACAWLYVTHLRPHVIGTRMHQEAQSGWLRGQYVLGAGEAVRALRRMAMYAFSRSLHGVVLLPGLLALGAALVRRRGLVEGVAAALFVLAAAASAAGTLPLGASRHSLHLLPVLVALGATGIGQIALWLSPRTPHEAPRARRWRLGIAAALLLPALGITAYRTLRVLGPGVEQALGFAQPEHVVRRAAVDEVVARVREAGPATWLTDHQTSLLLMPFAERAARRFVSVPGAALQTLDALGCTFLVDPHWMWTEADGAADDSVEQALARLPADGPLGPGRVGLIIGGWGVSPALRIAEQLRASGRSAAVHEALGDAGLALVVVDVTALRAWRHERALTLADDLRAAREAQDAAR